mmetsp:Transcript_101261/g.285457  ORF Transcript_101261/g.285457 Transcript_101261/m.285457 type:complete len:324 (+) Transcript_101261:62-1033(+)
MLQGTLGIVPGVQSRAPGAQQAADSYVSQMWGSMRPAAALPGRGGNSVAVRVAFAEHPTNPRPTRFSNTSIFLACAVEAAVVVPTVHVEMALAEDSWSLTLRMMISFVRLSPLFAPCLPCCQNLLGCGPRSRQTTLQRRLIEFGSVFLSAILCPEVRWGVAITLDMWYLLSTPLNEGLRDIPYIVLLVLNVLLCFGDTVMLIMMLAAKSEETPEPDNDVDIEAAQPRSFVFGAEADLAKFGPTCIICISEFWEGDNVAQLPCSHTFHTDCISKWLAKSRHCPLRCPQLALPPRVTQTPVEAVRLSTPNTPDSPDSSDAATTDA